MENKNSKKAKEELIQPLIISNNDNNEGENEKIHNLIWEESKKLWHVAGPSIISRIASFSMNVVTTAFAGHLGDIELASLSIANTVIVGFNFGLLVCFFYFILFK